MEFYVKRNHARSLSKTVALLFLPVIIYGCGGKVISVPYDPKAGVPEGYSVKRPLNFAIIPFADNRAGVDSRRKVVDVSANIMGVYGSELLLDEDVSTFVTNAVKEQLNYMGFKAQVAGGSFDKSMLKNLPAEIPSDVDMVIGGEIKRFRVEVAGRDKIEIELMTYIADRKNGRLLWSGATVEEADRFAGVMGNTRASVARYISKSLNSAVRKIMKESEQAFLQYGTAPSANAVSLPSQGLPLRHAPGTTQPEVDTAPAGKLTVTSRPSEAKFYINDTYYGKTPITIELNPGIYEVTAKLKGYKDEKEKVAIRPGISTELDIVFGN